MSRGAKDMFEGVQKQLLRRLLADTALQQRVERLSSIDGVGEITALSWALEVGDPHRFASIAEAVSYCGLTAALRSSAGKQQRGPISKQRNAWLQTALIEAAKLAPRWNPQLALSRCKPTSESPGIWPGAQRRSLRGAAGSSALFSQRTTTRTTSRATSR